jgi:L-ascorbate metabolism protein UlaG (beta-lactamase superfamily)
MTKHVTISLALLLSACAPSPAPVRRGEPPEALSIELAARSEPAAPLTLTRVAHASVLLDFDGEIVLTDPWFTESSQYHHGEPLGLALAELPHLTAVVASHGHYDHFDIEAFAAYPDHEVPFFVAPGMAEDARAAGFTNVHELRAWEEGHAGPITITAAPAEHGVPEVTFVLEGKGNTVFFGADTLRIAALDEVAERFPRIDLALLPVNGLRAVGNQVVMSAGEAAELTAVLHPSVAVPIHYAFRGGWFTENVVLAYDGTPDAFVAAARRRAPETRAVVLPTGQELVLRHHAAPSP